MKKCLGDLTALVVQLTVEKCMLFCNFISDLFQSLLKGPIGFIEIEEKICGANLRVSRVSTIC